MKLDPNEAAVAEARGMLYMTMASRWKTSSADGSQQKRQFSSAF